MYCSIHKATGRRTQRDARWGSKNPTGRSDGGYI